MRPFLPSRIQKNLAFLLLATRSLAEDYFEILEENSDIKINKKSSLLID